MDPRASGLGLSSDEAKRAADIEREIEDIRGNLDNLVSELDHRRHRLSPIRLFHEHPWLSSLVGGLLLAGVATVGALIYRGRARSQHSWWQRRRRLSSALDQLMAGKPVETSSGIGSKILTAAGTATAAVAGRRLARRLFWPSQGD